MKILSVDGGGVRGLYSVYLLKRIEEEYGINLSECFDIFAGTSTGAIIATTLATGCKAGGLVEFYENSEQIFNTSILTGFGILSAKFQHNISNLQVFLEDLFGDKKLGDIDNNLIITASNIVHGVPYIMTSGKAYRIKDELDITIVDALTAATAAPTYFNPKIINNYLLADGAIWANNPSSIAVSLALKKI